MFASSYKYKHSVNQRSYFFAVHTLQEKNRHCLKICARQQGKRRGALGFRSIITSIKNPLIDYEVIDLRSQTCSKRVLFCRNTHKKMNICWTEKMRSYDQVKLIVQLIIHMDQVKFVLLCRHTKK